MAVELETLYERVVGPQWRRVSEAVRRAHLRSDNLVASGVFYVKHGRGPIARFLIWLMRLPRSGSAIPVQLHVTPCPGGERWSRRFGERRIVTVQRAVAAGLLGERFGPLEFQFRLQIHDGAVQYTQQQVVIPVGKLCLRLPRWLAPQVSAIESAIGTNRTCVHVTMSLLTLRPLLEYGGELSVEETSA